MSFVLVVSSGRDNYATGVDCDNCPCMLSDSIRDAIPCRLPDEPLEAY